MTVNLRNFLVVQVTAGHEANLKFKSSKLEIPWGIPDTFPITEKSEDQQIKTKENFHEYN